MLVGRIMNCEGKKTNKKNRWSVEKEDKTWQQWHWSFQFISLRFLHLHKVLSLNIFFYTYVFLISLCFSWLWHKKTFQKKEVYFLSMGYCNSGNILSMVLLTFCLFSLNSCIFAFSTNCQMIVYELWNNYIVCINMLSWWWL